MTFRVVWKLTAIQILDTFRSSAIDPNSVEQAAAYIDYALRRDPLNMGESRSGRARLWYWDVRRLFHR